MPIDNVRDILVVVVAVAVVVVVVVVVVFVFVFILIFVCSWESDPETAGPSSLASIMLW